MTQFSSNFSVFRRPAAKLRQLLSQGCSPDRLAASVAVGVTVGLAPLVWGTSLICVALAWRFKLNQVAIQVGNYACYPLQIALFVPFLLAGQKLFIPSAANSSLAAWREALGVGPLVFLNTFWQANLCALVIWLLATPFLLGGCYLSLRVLLNRWQKKPDVSKSNN